MTARRCAIRDPGRARAGCRSLPSHPPTPAARLSPTPHSLTHLGVDAGQDGGVVDRGKALVAPVAGVPLHALRKHGPRAPVASTHCRPSCCCCCCCCPLAPAALPPATAKASEAAHSPRDLLRLRGQVPLPSCTLPLCLLVEPGRWGLGVRACGRACGETLPRTFLLGAISLQAHLHKAGRQASATHECAPGQQQGWVAAQLTWSTDGAAEEMGAAPGLLPVGARLVAHAHPMWLGAGLEM